jgi:hypothetical protein
VIFQRRHEMAGAAGLSIQQRQLAQAAMAVSLRPLPEGEFNSQMKLFDCVDVVVDPELAKR